MKALFVHDHPFYIDNTIVYSGGGLPSFFWNNYLSYFNNLSVFARKSKNLKDKKVVSSNTSVNFILTTNYTSFLDIIFKYGKLKVEILSELKYVDLVIIRLPSILGFIAATLAKKEGKVILIEQVGNAYESFNTFGSILGKACSHVLNYINKNIVYEANYVSYVTLSKLQKDYPTKSKITASIQNVIINEIRCINSINKEFYFNKIINIGLIGGFDSRYKGQEILIKAIANLPDKYKSIVNLYFVGKGNYNWIIKLADKLQIKNNIKFIGSKVSGNEIFNFLDNINLYVQPSLTEGMPRAMLEAMSRGCPVLATFVGGIPEIIEKEFLHYPGDYITLSNQIKLFLDDREFLFKQSLNNIVSIKPFLINNLNDKRNIFYKKIISDIKNA
jgi:glycosyltransferase involved in cell wall biosynthesis